MNTILSVFDQFPHIRAGFIGKPFDFSNHSAALESLYPEALWNRFLQVHGTHVADASDNTLDEADGMYTQAPLVGCHARMADCSVGLFYNSETQEIASIHAGWKGLAQNIFGKYLSKHNTRTYMHVSLSPSLGKCCAEFTNPFEETPDFFHPFVEKRDTKYFVDLWAIAKNQLLQAGVPEKNISMPLCCTACSPDWWSHRRKESARNVGFIYIKQNEK